MKMLNLKQKLYKHDLKLWQLCQVIGINRTTLTTWSHTGFSGHIATVKHGLDKLLHE